MAFRIPPKVQAEWVPAIEAAAAVFKLAPDLDPNDIKDAIENAVRSGSLLTRDIDAGLLGAPGFTLLFNWDLEACTVCLASQSISPLAWRWVPFVLRQSDVISLFQEAEEVAPAGKRSTGKRPTVKETIKDRILEAMRAGRDIGDRDHDAITAEFGGGASRGTCVAALREALSVLGRR